MTTLTFRPTIRTFARGMEAILIGPTNTLS